MDKVLVITGSDFSTNKLTTIEFGEIVPCTGLSLSANSVSFTALGGTQTVIATKTPADTTDTVLWGTSNSSVATVSSDGVITSVGEGTATITATCGTQTATCSVSVVNEPVHVLVARYNPYRRGAGNHAATVEKKTSTTSYYHILAANNADTSILPIEDKDDMDTGEWRFVPLVLPMGATGFVITSEYQMKTRILWFDNTKVSDVNGKGAWIVEGNTSDSFDQADWSTTVTLTRPETAGVNSFGGLVYTREHTDDSDVDASNVITITYTYS